MSDQQPEFPQIPKNATLLYDEHGNIYGYSVKPSLWDKCKKEPLVPIGNLIFFFTFFVIVGFISDQTKVHL